MVGLIWQVMWMSTAEHGKGSKSECVYSGSGKMPLLCASCAFIGLAIAMLVEHTFLLMAVSNSSPALLTLDPDSASAKSLTWQSGFFFVTTWWERRHDLCFFLTNYIKYSFLFWEIIVWFRIRNIMYLCSWAISTWLVKISVMCFVEIGWNHRNVIVLTIK